jgi:hypothetical protein
MEMRLRDAGVGGASPERVRFVLTRWKGFPMTA